MFSNWGIKLLPRLVTLVVQLPQRNLFIYFRCWVVNILYVNVWQGESGGCWGLKWQFRSWASRARSAHPTYGPDISLITDISHMCSRHLIHNRNLTHHTCVADISLITDISHMCSKNLTPHTYEVDISLRTDISQLQTSHIPNMFPEHPILT